LQYSFPRATWERGKGEEIMIIFEPDGSLLAKVVERVKYSNLWIVK